MRQFQQLRRLDTIHLVEDEDHLAFLFVETAQNGFSLFVDPLLHIDEHQNEIGVLGSAPSGRDHCAVQTAFRLENAGRIDEHHLRLFVR